MKAILFDANYCIGCGSCVDACVQENNLPEDAPDKLSEHRFTRVSETGDYYMRSMCMHCVEPSCASACPVGALHKTDAGPVAYDYEKCIGCRYCMVACPFQVPRYEWSSRLPRVRKCEMCKRRVAEGKSTACAESCPAEATLFGERDEMIATAWRRIADDPDAYASHVYGLSEVGGTCVLVIGPQQVLDQAFDARIPNEPLPEKTWVVLSQIPTAVGVAGASLLGLNWILRRRMKLMGGNGASDSKRSDELRGEQR
jgi:formate dehydrogenase iron-sulfur subunit